MNTAKEPRSASQHACRGEHDIAIVGMACMFPKSPDLRRYWENIMRKLDCIEEVPSDRWQAEHFFDEDRFAKDKVYSKWGGFLSSIRFDPMKWKIPPASLLSIDPIQLLSLEVANRAFEDAGYHEREFPKERTGVIFACAGSHDVGSDYAFRTMLQHYLPRVTNLTPEMRANITEELNSTLPEWTEDSFPGFLMNVIAGRIANRFDLGGPNYVVDAACAASLAALHAAIAQLRLKTVDAMLVGAADGTNNPFCYMSFAKTHALSPRGRSRPFDNSADGIALGEGIGAIMLRRLSDAERDGDQIYAVIKGIGASSDGRNRSMTAPHPPGQMLAMERAYTDADVPAASVSLVEAHGTGTAVGDSTEITSLHTLFSEATSDEQYAAVGSVKSMIGHTKTCAGLASLIKTAMALKHRVLPPTIHVDKPNEKVDFRHSPFYINTETRPWFEELGEHPRRAGVSAFGFGGTNFHVVMEEYTHAGEPSVSVDFSPRTAELCVWRRPSRDELLAALKDTLSLIAELPTSDLAQLAMSLHVDETQQPAAAACRLAIVAGSVEDLRLRITKAIEQLATKSELRDPGGIYYSEQPAVSPQEVAFLYPGQGSQAVNMLRDLAVVQPWAHALFATANQTLQSFFPRALTRYIFPPPTFTPGEAQERQSQLNDTRVAQPALGTVELFATELLQRFGIQPAAVAGHSYGEYVALHAAGALSQTDLLTLSAHRGAVSADASESCPGGMAAIQASAIETQRFVAEHHLKVSLANLNCPRQTIVAGAEDAIEATVALFNAHKIRATRLPVTAAFHTEMLEPAVEPLSAALKSAKFRTPKLPVYSNTLAQAYPRKPAEIRKLLQRHIVEPVRFEEEVRQMRADGYQVFLEVGPGRVLTNLVGRIFETDPPVALPLDAPGQDGVLQFAHVLAQLTALGLPVDISQWFRGRGLREESLVESAARIVREQTPQRCDWILSLQGARPVTPLPVRKNQPGDGLRAKFSGATGTRRESGTLLETGTEPQSAVKTANGHAVELREPVRPADTNGHPVTESAKTRGNIPPTEPATMPVAPAPLPVDVRFAKRNGTHAEHQTAANGQHGGQAYNGTGGHTTRRTAESPTQRPVDSSGHQTAPVSANGSLANGSLPTVAAANGASANGTASNGVAANGAAPNGHSTTHASSPHTSRTPATATVVRAVSKPLVIPGSDVPLAPCLPLVTNWNSSKPLDVPVPAAGVVPLPASNLKRSTVSTPQSPLADNGQSLHPAAAQLIQQSQAMMMQMLDLQKWQQQVALRFMDAHQQLVQGCVTGHLDALPAPAPAATDWQTAAIPTATIPTTAMPAAAAPAYPTAAAAPVASATPAPAVPMGAPAAQQPTAVAPRPVVTNVQPVAVKPVPVPVAVAAAPSPAVRKTSEAAAPVTMTSTVAAAPVASVTVVAKPKPAAEAAAMPEAVNGAVVKVVDAPTTSSDVPTTEAFQRDLLEAVSERTGYPVDMLDLQLPMESGLGIDSIKTVEIFSNLKVYHAYFQQDDQDEEEALKEFTRLKTLGDIVSAYDLRYQALTSAGSTPKLTNGAHEPGAEVERYTLSAVESPVANGQKKTSRVTS